jgi:hypothetical protein
MTNAELGFLNTGPGLTAFIVSLSHQVSKFIGFLDTNKVDAQKNALAKYKKTDSFGSKTDPAAETTSGGPAPNLGSACWMGSGKPC